MAYLDIDLGDDRPVVSIVSSFSELPREVEALVDGLNNFPLGIQAWELHPTSPGLRSDDKMRTMYADLAKPSIAHVLVVGNGFTHPKLDIPFDVASVELQYIRYWHERAADRGVPYVVALWSGTHGGAKQDSHYAQLRTELERHHWCIRFEGAQQLCSSVLSLLTSILEAREFDFDVAISFAGPDRQSARDLALALQQRGLRVFFDEFVQSELLGTDLAAYFGDVFEHKARYCLMLTSSAYLTSSWANHERQHAQTRQLREPGGYILQVRLDESRVPGVPDTVGYFNYTMPELVADVVESRVRAGRRPSR